MPAKFSPIDHPKQADNPRLDNNVKTQLNEYMLNNLENRDSIGANFAQFLIIVLDLIALIIYLDLFLVVRYKKHLFTFAIEYKLIAQRQLKPY